MFVVFEGIDGSGKTTVSNLVAEALRERGIVVEHIREGGTFSSPLVNRMREFGKDTRNLAMAPLTELLMYVARDAQLLSECIRPALARGNLVFADRYLYSYEVLGHYGRGLPLEQVQAIIDAVAENIWPDLVVLMDVDPHVARARRRVSKLARKAAGEPKQPKENVGGSRKGLQGAGTLHRLREGYLALAKEDPERWVVIDNSNTEHDSASLDEIVNSVTGVIARLWQRHSRSGIPVLSATHRPRTSSGIVPISGFLEGREAFYEAVIARARREKVVAAYFLAKLDDAPAYDLREQWAEHAAEAVAHGLSGLNHERAWALRERLADLAPYHVARSVGGVAVDPERARAMRAFFRDSQPVAVLASIRGQDTDEAWSLRDALAGDHLGRVVASLSGLDSERAWELRERYHAELVQAPGSELGALTHLIDSLTGLDSERAWALRDQYLEPLPVAVLKSLSQIGSERAWALRQRYVTQAPKIVMRTFDGSRDPRAWALRRIWAPTVKESLGSMISLDDNEAWGIREACRDIWPSTTVKSLGTLGVLDRGRDMAEELLARYPNNISLLKHITRLAHLEETGDAGGMEDPDDSF